MLISYIFNALNFSTLFFIFMILILVVNNGINNKKTLLFLILLIDNFLCILFFTAESLAFHVDIAIIFAKMTFIALCFFPVIVLLLVLEVINLNLEKKPYSWLKYIFFLPSLFFIAAVLLKKYSLSVMPIDNGYYVKIHAYSTFFVLFQLAYTILSVLLLFYFIKEKKTDNLKRKELYFLFIGFSIPLIYMVIIAGLQVAGFKIGYPFEIWFILASGVFLYYGISRYGIILGNVFNKKIFNSSLLLIAGVNLSGEVFEANDSFLKTLGLTRKEIYGKQINFLIKKSLVNFTGFENIFKFIDSMRNNQKISGSETNSVFKVFDKNKKCIKYFELNFNPIFVNKLLFGHIFLLNDITGRKVTENLLVRKQRLLEAVVKSINELLSNSDLRQAIINVLEKIGNETQVDRVYIFENYKNIETGKVISSRKFEWTNDTVEALIENQDFAGIEFEECFPEMFKELESNNQFSGFVKDFPVHIKKYFEEQNINSILIVPIFVEQFFWGFIGLDECHEMRKWEYDEIITIKAAAEVIGDAISHRRMSDNIKQLAYYDIITKLPNRALFYERVKLSLEISKRNKRLLALILMDFDKFKDINDTYGHNIGDEFLKVFALRVSEILRKTDTISRFGGDEFIFLITELKNEDDVRKIAEKILKCFEKPFIVLGHSLVLKGSLGIAIYPKNGIEVVDLVKNADIAMYRAKKTGGNKYQYYSNNLEE
jgi:diguanylate cyclase (GGDEF)-like protein/PAS domain S-box-containing protein